MAEVGVAVGVRGVGVGGRGVSVGGTGVSVGGSCVGGRGDSLGVEVAVKANCVNWAIASIPAENVSCASRV